MFKSKMFPWLICLLLLITGCVTTGRVSDTTAEKKSAATLRQTKTGATAVPGSQAAAPAGPAKPAAIKFSHCRNPRSCFYQAHISRGWNNSAFKYISVDGLRFSQAIIMNYVKDPKNNSIFFLKPGGCLGMELNEHYDIEVAFYPPDEKGHEVFKQFKIYILDGNGEIVQTEEVTGRMKKYKITR